MTTRAIDHDVPGDAPTVAPPLTPVEPARRRSPAEEARTIVANGSAAGLATLTSDGEPWASLVTYATLGDGSPVLCVSTLAEHGRNLVKDPRASLMVASPGAVSDPLANGRVTLAGRAERLEGERLAEGREAFLAAVPESRHYIDFRDFTLWAIAVERVRWVGGYGRMDSATGSDYATAEPDPTGGAAPGAVTHLNDDHADALHTIATVLGGHPDATAATCTSIDRYGLDLTVKTPRGIALTRVAWAEPVAEPGGLRAASVALVQKARAAA